MPDHPCPPTLLQESKAKDDPKEKNDPDESDAERHATTSGSIRATARRSALGLTRSEPEPIENFPDFCTSNPVTPKIEFNG